MKGSFSVEAALILPLIICIIFGFISLGLYLHDCICIQAIIDKCGVKAQDEIRILGEDAIEKRLLKDIKEETAKKLCITKLETMKVEVQLVTIHIEYCEHRYLNLPGIQVFLGNAVHSREKNIIIYNPMKAVRSLGGLKKDDSGV